MRTLGVSRCVDVVVEEAAEIGRLCRAGSAAPVRHCPGWTGADLLAHLVAYQRWVTDLVSGTITVDADLPDVGGPEALSGWDAESAAPVRADVARDGIDEYFDTLVDTAVAAGAPQARHAATLRFDRPDPSLVIERHLREPGPVTVLRGTASDLLLALWHPRDPSPYVVDGDRALIAARPHT